MTLGIRGEGRANRTPALDFQSWFTISLPLGGFCGSQLTLIREFKVHFAQKFGGRGSRIIFQTLSPVAVGGPGWEGGLGKRKGDYGEGGFKGA